MKNEFKINGEIYLFPYTGNQFQIKFEPQGNHSKNKLYGCDAYRVNELKNYILLIKDNSFWLLNFDIVFKYFKSRIAVTTETKIDKIVNLLNKKLRQMNIIDFEKSEGK